MAHTLTLPGGPGAPPDRPPADGPRRRVRPPGGVDVLFRFGLRGAGLLVLAVMVTVGLFLFQRGAQAFAVAGPKFFTTQAWQPDSHNFGVAAVLTGTALIAAVAIAVAVPLATGVALYICEYAPRRLRPTLTSLIDLMAAVPSVVYGLWGFFFLQHNVLGLARWISVHFGWVPFLRVDGTDPNDPLATPTVYTSSAFIAGTVVGLMVLPIICSVMREAFTQAPQGEREGAYALGATHWGMISSVVLPFGRSGMIGGTMLGLGRAMGETIAVYMIIAPVFQIQTHILQNGTNSVSALIALHRGTASPFELSALMAAGLTLFGVTLIINFLASLVIARSRSGQDSGA